MICSPLSKFLTDITPYLHPVNYSCWKLKFNQIKKASQRLKKFVYETYNFLNYMTLPSTFSVGTWMITKLQKKCTKISSAFEIQMLNQENLIIQLNKIRTKISIPTKKLLTHTILHYYFSFPFIFF